MLQYIQSWYYKTYHSICNEYVSTCSYYTLSWAYRLLITAIVFQETEEMQLTYVASSLPSMPWLQKGYPRDGANIHAHLRPLCQFATEESSKSRVDRQVWGVCSRWLWSFECWWNGSTTGRVGNYRTRGVSMKLWTYGLAWQFSEMEVHYFFEGPMKNIPSVECQLPVKFKWQFPAVVWGQSMTVKRTDKHGNPRIGSRGWSDWLHGPWLLLTPRVLCPVMISCFFMMHLYHSILQGMLLPSCSCSPKM